MAIVLVASRSKSIYSCRVVREGLNEGGKCVDNMVDGIRKW